MFTKYLLKIKSNFSFFLLIFLSTPKKCPFPAPYIFIWLLCPLLINLLAPTYLYKEWGPSPFPLPRPRRGRGKGNGEGAGGNLFGPYKFIKKNGGRNGAGMGGIY